MEMIGSTLVVNPYLQIKQQREGGSISALMLRAPIKGQPMKVTKIDRTVEPDLFSALLIHSNMGTIERANFTDAERTRLRDVGVLLAPEDVSTPVYFSCDLDDLPLELVPTRMHESIRGSEDRGELVVNATLQFLGKKGPTGEMRGHVELRNAFRDDRSCTSQRPSNGRAQSLFLSGEDF